jgi:FKBP-type peptidyl-prolyl cis-trans isomerase FklB
MKKINIQALLLLAVFTTFSVNTQAQKKGKSNKTKGNKTEEVKSLVLANEIDSVSYSVGFNMGKSIKTEFSEGNIEAIMAGLKASVKDTSFAIPESEMQAVVTGYFQKKQVAKQAEEAGNTEKMKASGLQFLAENKTKPGVVTTASGLQYLVMKEGTGKQPTATSNVTVHYHGTTPDGTVFDSSVDRGQPATFGLNQVIKGWTEGVALMKEGAKYKFFIPQELAYGASPRPGTAIKPYMPLVFELELITVNE